MGVRESHCVSLSRRKGLWIECNRTSTVIRSRPSSCAKLAYGRDSIAVPRAVVEGWTDDPGEKIRDSSGRQLNSNVIHAFPFCYFKEKRNRYPEIARVEKKCGTLEVL